MDDNLDRDVSSRYLVAVALQEAVGTRDIVSRYGRYKFLLIISQDGIERVRADMDNAQWLLKSFPILLSIHLNFGASYGIAFSRKYVNLDEFMKLADDKMYENKRRDKQVRNIGQAGPIPFEPTAMHGRAPSFKAVPDCFLSYEFDFQVFYLRSGLIRLPLTPP